jgi:hypothetical protein
MVIPATNDPKRDPIDKPGGKHGDRVPEVIDPPDPRRPDPPGPDSPRRPEDVPPQEVEEVVRDRNWVSSRQPTDIPAFHRDMIALFLEATAKRAGA